MTKLNNRMRRLVALLLCACMLLGNVGTGLSELTKASRLVLPLTQEQIAAMAASGPLAEAPLSDYTSTLVMTTNPELKPGQVVTDGMKLEVHMNFEFSSGTIGEGTSEEKTDYWIRHAHTLGLVKDDTVFYVPITAATRLEGSNYPKAGNPKVAEYLGVPAFQWWVDEANNRICFQFLRAVFHETANVTSMSVSFSGQLNLEEGAGSNTLQFGVVGETVTLTAQQEYTLTKSVVTQPYYSAEENCYLADFQVKLTTKRDMLLSTDVANPDGLFAAALTLKDTLAAGSVLSGEVVGTPTITSPEDSAEVIITKTRQADKTTNLMTLSSNGVMKAGDHIISFTMKLTDEAVLKAATEYSAAQKTNYVELLENEQSILTSQVQVDLTNVKNHQFKIFKYEYSQPDSYFGPVYSVKNADGTLSYRSDFHVIVMIDKEVETFTFEDRVNHSMNFFANEPVTLVGVWNGEGFMEANRNTPIANFAQVDASTVTVTNEVRTERTDQPNYFNKVTVTANDGGLLAPGAYLFKIPADLTRPIEITLYNDGYGQYYGNTVYLTKIDDLTPTNISSRYEGRIPVLQLPNKVGTFQTVAEKDHNSLVMHDGKPVIRWDVPFNWDMPHAFTLVDTMENMELLIDGDHPFQLHVMKDGKSNKLLLNLNSLKDCVDNNIIDWYPDEGGVFKLNLTNVGDNALTDKDGKPVVSYKLVYFTTPATVGDSYVLNGTRNTIDTSVNIPDSGISDTFTPSVGIPTLGAEKELEIFKTFNEELNDTTTEWTITLKNPDQALFSYMSKLEILDIVPYRQHTDDINDNQIESNKTYFMPGEVTIHQGMAPIVRMDDMTLEAGKDKDYQVEYRLKEGTENCYTMAIVFNIKALKQKVTDDTFDNITVTTYLKNPRRELLGLEQNDAYIRNNGTANYTYLGVDLTCNHTAQSPKKRSFAERDKACLGYGDFYDVKTGTYDASGANGDGIKDILWQLHIGAREFKITNKEHVITITDTLTGDHVFPVYDGKEFKDLFTIVSKNNPSKTLEVQSATLSEDRKSFTMTFVLPAPQNGIGWGGDTNVDDGDWYSSNVLITYHTVIDQEALDAKRQAAIAEGEEEVTLEYSNAALMDWYNDNPEPVKVEGSHILSTSMLDKVASVNETTNQISYTIPINEQALTLNNGEPLVLRDQLTDGGENFLYQEPIVLKNVRTGQVLTPGSAVSETTYTLRMLEGNAKGFEIKVPDGMSLLLTYQVVPKLAAGQMTDELTNEASLNGLGKEHVNRSYQVSAATEGVVVTPKDDEVIISIEKLKKSGFEAHLPGAVFTATPVKAVKAVKADGTLELEMDASKTLTATSDDTGFARFSIPVNQANGFSVVYCIQETQAPAGHKLDKANVWYYLLRSEIEPTAEALQVVEALEAARKTVKTVYKKSKVLTIEEIVCYNEPIYTDLQVYKQSKTGVALTGAELMLTDANGTGVGNPVYNAEKGCLVFSKLEFGTYTLTETKPPEGYHVATPNSWTIVLGPGENANDPVSVSVVWPENTADTAKAYVVAAPKAAVPSLTVLNDAVTPATVNVAVKKVWDDKDDQDGKRPASLTVTLSNSQTVELNEDNDWTATIKNLPKYKDGVEIAYTWTEPAVAGYTLTNTAVTTVTDAKTNETATLTTLTNTYTPETVNVAVKKVWEDAENQDGKRPTSLTVTLSNGTEVTLNEANEWSATVENLPKYAAGKEITYTWSEPEVTGYTRTNTAESSVTDEETKKTTILTTITNSHITETVNVAVKKVWDDKDNQDGKRPTSLKVTLSNGKEVELNAANDWTVTVENLPKYAAGKVITYTWMEDTASLPEGYSFVGSVDSDLTDEEGNVIATLTTITNTYTPKTIDITGTKTWDDANNQDGIRPESITINLLADGTIINKAVVKANEDGQWMWQFTDLPQYRDQGVEIVYSITETLAEGTAYSAKVDGYNVTNTYTPATVDVTGSKMWIDLNNAHHTRPESITIRLYADGTEIATQEANVDNNWSWSFKDLPKYAVGNVGHEVTYTVSEDAVPGYVTTQNGYNFTNTVQVVAFQKLDEQTGKPLSGAQFALYEGRLTAPAGTPLMIWTSTGTPSVLAGLSTGKTYTIFETKTPFGYVTMTPFVFTVQPTDIPATMRTFVANNCHSYRFRKLSTVNNELVYGAEMAIKQEDTVIATWYTDFENDGWHYVADTRFKPGVTYTLVELTAPNGYQLAAPVHFTIDSEDGFLIVNGNDTNDMSVVMYDQPVPEASATPEPTTTSFRITKRWEDQDNVLGLRPNSIVVNLYRKAGNNASYPDAPYLTVTINSDGTDEWNFTFDDLPRRDSAGRLYTYMAQEEPVDGYVTTYLNNGRTIVNSIPKEDLPPTPTPTLPYVTPTPSPMPRVPAGVQFVDGKWVYVDEYGVPLGIVPLTGDNTNFALWGSAIALPMIIAALAAVEIRRRKHRMAVEGKEK